MGPSNERADGPEPGAGTEAAAAAPAPEAADTHADAAGASVDAALDPTVLRRETSEVAPVDTAGAPLARRGAPVFGAVFAALALLTRRRRRRNR